MYMHGKAAHPISFKIWDRNGELEEILSGKLLLFKVFTAQELKKTSFLYLQLFNLIKISRTKGCFSCIDSTKAKITRTGSHQGTDYTMGC
jgi:hypothetical protein